MLPQPYPRGNNRYGWSTTVDHPLNTFIMVVPFAVIAAWLWGMSHPYPWEPLWKG